jgi:hypothetical protein
MRMQSLLFGMHWLRRHLLPLPATTQGPPCCAGVRTLKSLSLSLSLSLFLSIYIYIYLSLYIYIYISLSLQPRLKPQVCVRRQSY